MPEKPQRDWFPVLLASAACLALVVPCRGTFAEAVQVIADVAIGLLFFLHGARLSREAIVAGVTNVRLHALILASTFVLFPLLGLALRPLLEPLVGRALYAGVLFLCALPSTVQSSIAMTSLARGNIAAAVCAASLSSIVGIFVSPLLASVLVATQTATSPVAFGSLLVQLLLPFVAGHLLRPFVGARIERARATLKWVDQGAIALVVYIAFSHAMSGGYFSAVSWASLAVLVVVISFFLVLALGITRGVARALRLPVEDEITLVFCGSKKSLTSGIPIANAVFDPATVGLVVLPVMLYHQIQLMVGALLARRYAAREAPAT